MSYAKPHDLRHTPWATPHPHELRHTPKIYAAPPMSYATPYELVISSLEPHGVISQKHKQNLKSTYYHSNELFQTLKTIQKIKIYMVVRIQNLKRTLQTFLQNKLSKEQFV
jgi:hypothetical protein